MSSNDRVDSTQAPHGMSYEAAMSEFPELPETWRSAVYREAAKIGLTESDPLWWFLVAHTVLLKTFLDSLPVRTVTSNGQNGSEALKTLLDQHAASLKAIPGRDEVASKEDLQRIQQEVSHLSQAFQKSDQAREKQLPELRLVVEDLKFATGAMNKRLSEAGMKPPAPWWMKWGRGLGIGAVIALIFFLAGRYEDARQQVIVTREANGLLIDALKRLPSASNVTTFLRSKGGDLTIDRIKLADGRDGAGIIISPGSLKLGTPSMSKEGGNALVPIEVQ